MKAFITALLLLMAAPAYCDELAERMTAIPNPRLHFEWVADPSGVIASRRADINRLIATLNEKTSTEIAVVVLPTIGTIVPKDFAVALLKKWSIGKKGKDNGVLVLHILDQKRIEIETGYGMEGILPDAKVHWMTDEIAIPFFKKSSIADGHYEVVRALVRAIEQPNITQANLLSQLETQPGATTDRVPRAPVSNAVAAKNAPVTDSFFYGNWMPIALLVVGGIFYLVITVMIRLRSRNKEPYAKYQLFASGLSRLQYVAAVPAAALALVFENSRTDTFFTPIPVLLVLGFLLVRSRSKTLKALREAPRTCQCGKTMHRLNEQQDDAYIEKGNVAEESIGSVDYDVWLCACGKSIIESYQGKSPAEPCVQCHYRTYRVTNTRTLRSATTVATGMREITHICANCSYQKIDNVVIPVIATSSSSSGRSGSSGSSSGSFGGGRSGGGGAGSSY